MARNVLPLRANPIDRESNSIDAVEKTMEFTSSGPDCNGVDCCSPKTANIGNVCQRHSCSPIIRCFSENPWQCKREDTSSSFIHLQPRSLVSKPSLKPRCYLHVRSRANKPNM
ncbi:hypothetical protein EUGRSUZ_A00827 [Eucalyptus grandis]|uniref:Uncharacterized protein n=2 Tax=Eucalyptus grandis TaxID=71139 RepID=A0ACC3M0M9_EUCGR|nr:hypothetical protein EUGRSUZ_A00827 [Eucalyptus grandis]